MKQKNRFTALVVLFSTLFLAEHLAAQTLEWRRGPRRGRQQRIHQQAAPQLGVFFGHDFDLQSNVVGGNIALPLGRFWQVVPGVEYALNGESEFERWMFNGDLVFNPSRVNGLYFGGGLAVEYRTADEAASDLQYGLNALVGLEFGRAPFKLFIQSRWTFLDETYFTAMGGFRLALR